MSTAPRSLFLPLCCAAALPSKPLPTEEPAVYQQACNHYNRGSQITKMAHSKSQEQHKPWLFSFWPIQLNYNDECLMPITVYIPSNKHYSSHRGSYHVTINWCNAMLPFWCMSNVISLNQFSHFWVYWPQTSWPVTWKTLLLTSSHKDRASEYYCNRCYSLVVKT